MITPADIRADLGLKTDRFDGVIGATIVAMEFAAPFNEPEHRLRLRIATHCRRFDDIDRALFWQDREVA